MVQISADFKRRKKRTAGTERAKRNVDCKGAEALGHSRDGSAFSLQQSRTTVNRARRKKRTDTVRRRSYSSVALQTVQKKH